MIALENTNWQLWTNYHPTSGVVTAMNAAGTGLQSPVAIQAFTPGVSQPTMFSTDTKELVNGSLITFGAGLNGLSKGYALRVFDLIQNVSFKVQIPFQWITPASTPTVCYPTGASDNGASVYGPMGGWTKPTSLVAWADDFVANRCPGAKRVLGLRKGSATREVIQWSPARKASVGQLRGRQISIGTFVRQKVGGGGLRIYLYDGSAVTYSAPATGSTFVDAQNNHYQFVSVSARMGMGMEYFEAGFEFAGSVGDIAYAGIPTIKYGPSIAPDDLAGPIGLIRADSHWNPIKLTPFVGQWPNEELIAGTGVYGYALDLEALSFGQCHSSVSAVKGKVEYLSPHPDSICFVWALHIPTNFHKFGLQTRTQVANLNTDTNMGMIPLFDGYPEIGSPPGMFGIASNLGGTAVTNLTFDFDDVEG